MPRTTHPKPHPVPESEGSEGVVRMELAIPAMDRPVAAKEACEANQGMVCTGHCGRCQVNPCQLHAKLAFRI